MLGCGRKLAAFAAAISLLAGSGAAVAAHPTRAPAPTPEATVPARTADPWLMLSMMTASSSNASAAEAAQGENVPISWPHIVPLSVVLGTIATAIYILLDEDSHNRNGTNVIMPGLGLRPTPLSPG